MRPLEMVFVLIVFGYSSLHRTFGDYSEATFSCSP